MAARVSDVRRARAARVLRNLGTWQQAADAAGLESKRTIGRWLKEPDFINLLHARGIMVAGPLRITADDSATLEDVDTDESVVWIATADAPAVLGSVVVSDASFLRLVFVPADDVAGVQADIEAKRFPLVPDARQGTLVQSALTALTDADELLTVTRLFTAEMRESFATWLSLWKFRAGESRDVRTLGELWEGQALLADALCENPHTFLLKARKLGATELSLAFAGYCARVRDVNARIALYSYRERAALDLLAKVRFGLDNLPPHLRLPFRKDPTLKSLEYDAGHEDVRTVVSYPTSQNTSIETTSTHALCDEFAHWPHGERTFAALEPTFTAPRATSQLLTTGRGPADWSATYWRACKDGDGLHRPVCHWPPRPPGPFRAGAARASPVAVDPAARPPERAAHLEGGRDPAHRARATRRLRDHADLSRRLSRHRARVLTPALRDGRPRPRDHLLKNAGWREHRRLLTGRRQELAVCPESSRRVLRRAVRSSRCHFASLRKRTSRMSHPANRRGV